jgi:prefoldin subunit 5
MSKSLFENSKEVQIEQLNADMDEVDAQIARLQDLYEELNDALEVIETTTYEDFMEEGA